ncbi:hypothetical protein Tco_0543702, partial [Tanacetum coccineum]
MKSVQPMSLSMTPVKRSDNPESGCESYMPAAHGELPNSISLNMPKPLEKLKPPAYKFVIEVYVKLRWITNFKKRVNSSLFSSRMVELWKVEDRPRRNSPTYKRTNRRAHSPPKKTLIENITTSETKLKSIIKDHNKRNKANPIRLNFEIEDQDLNEDRIVKGKEIDDEDLSKHFKETLKTPFTRRIIEFSGLEYSMPTNIALYNGSTDPANHLNRFVGAANSEEWPMPVWCRREQTNRAVPVLSLDSLTKCPKEILATEMQLQLPPPRPKATRNRLRAGKAESLDERPEEEGGKETKQKPSSAE